MNQPTNVGSNKEKETKENLVMVVGGNSIPLENGKIEMPPENAKEMSDLSNQLWNDYTIEISTIDGAINMGKYSNAEINRLEQERKSRMTKTAIERRAREEQNQGMEH